MHLDESKKFDKRNIQGNLKDGIITIKDYENYLAKLPDVSDKVYFQEEDLNHLVELSEEDEINLKKKNSKKKSGRGK